MISLGRLLMNIDLEEIFKNAFEIAKKCFFIMKRGNYAGNKNN